MGYDDILAKGIDGALERQGAENTRDIMAAIERPEA